VARIALDSMDLECDEADDLRDESDPWWYAMDNYGREKFEIELIKFRKGKYYDIDKCR
jgi:hypothetical protein